LKISSIHLFSIIIILCFGIIVYSNSYYCPFHFDDFPSIVNNSYIRNIYHLHSIWHSLPRRFILYLSIAFNYHFNGKEVLGYHLFNLGVHLGAAILVWWLILLTFLTPAIKEEKIARHANIIALLVGLVFVVHPVQTEAVTYIVQRATSMATLFYLASLCFYVKSRLLVNKGGGWYIFSIIMAIMAMFTKETAITLPLMILLYEFSFLKNNHRFNWSAVFPFLLTMSFIPVTMLFTESGALRMHELRSEPCISSLHYFLTQIRVMVTYIRLIFLPLHQNLDYDYPISKSIFEAPTIISFLFLSTILYSAKRLFLKYRVISFSIFWFFLTLLPESSFLPIKDVIFEHRLYLPLVGYSVFLVSGLYYLLGKNTIGMMIVLAMIITGYSVLTYERNKVWKDEYTLWNDVIRQSPNKARAYLNRGCAFYNQGNFDKSVSDYNKAIQLKTDVNVVYYVQGCILDKQGNFTKAIADYNQAIKLDPKNVDAYYNRGNVYYKQGNFAQAILDYNEAIVLNPNNEDEYNNRGLAYSKQGNFIKAISDYNKAIELNPKDVDAYQNRAISYYKLKEYDKFLVDVHNTEELRCPFNAKYLNKLKTEAGIGK